MGWNPSLHRRLVSTEKSPYTMEEAKVFVRMLKLATESDVSEEEILELVFGVSFDSYIAGNY